MQVAFTRGSKPLSRGSRIISDKECRQSVILIFVVVFEKILAHSFLPVNILEEVL